MNKVNILGTTYTITKKKFDEEESFARLSIDGFCNGLTKEIIVCEMKTYKGWDHETEDTIIAAEKQTLRHEIVHAFFNESGLMDSSSVYSGAWVKNEELVDWIANQGEKIYKAWKEADCLG